MNEENTKSLGSWLAPLGLVGLRSIEAPLLAALITEQPLLLIGPHGTAKSLLLNRVAAALGLSFRHYNASLLNFDDLVGFPVPAANLTLEYLKTPAAIWGAGAVIFDEVSRCRPDIQNKLFPIIHERKVQGLDIDGLRYRWAAMNPPTIGADDGDYAGSEPLDRALADRFGFVVQMPSWADFSPTDKRAIIQSQERTYGPQEASILVELLELASAILRALKQDFSTAAADYVYALMPLLSQVKLELSPRRANLLYQAVLAVHASSLALQPDMTFADSAFLALRSCLPQRAEGIPIAEVKLLAAHREAIRAVSLSPQDPLRAILGTAKPLERFKLAVRSTHLPKGEFSRVVADSLAQLHIGAREAAIVHLFETGAVGRLNAAVASQVGEHYRDIATPAEFSETLHASHGRYKTWSKLKDLLASLNPDDPRAHLQANALASLFAKKELQTPEEAVRAFHAFSQTEAKVRQP